MIRPLSIYLILLVYGGLLFSPQISLPLPDSAAQLSDVRTPVAFEAYRTSLFLDPEQNKNGQQNILEVLHNRASFLQSPKKSQAVESLKTYPRHNSYLHFNYPRICYKFPRSEHTKEG